MAFTLNGAENQVPAIIQVPGRWRPFEAWLTVTALGVDEVIVAAAVNGDPVAAIYVRQSGAFLARMRADLLTASQFSPGWRCPPVVLRREAELPMTLVQLPGQRMREGLLDARVMDRDYVMLDVRLGSETLAIYVFGGQNFAALVGQRLGPSSPTTTGAAAPGGDPHSSRTARRGMVLRLFRDRGDPRWRVAFRSRGNNRFNAGGAFAEGLTGWDVADRLRSRANAERENEVWVDDRRLWPPSDQQG